MTLPPLHLVADHLWVLANAFVLATTIVLSPFAVREHLRGARRAVVQLNRMDRAPTLERWRWPRDASAVLLLSMLVAGLHALGQVHQGFFSLACVTGAGVTTAGALIALAVFIARARQSGWRGIVTAIGGAAAGAVGGMAMAVVLGALQRATGLDFVWDSAGAPYPLSRELGSGLAMSVLVSCLWGVTVAYPEAIDEARRRAIEADRALREAELARLRACLEPHFLLNSLHAVAGLVDDEPRVARRLLECLGDLYRDALERADDVQPLGTEIAWLRRYAEILEVRHAGALAFRWEIDADAEVLRVPTMLLQPLVENAVKHGALAASGVGEVVVRARVEPATDGGAPSLTCEIEDDGPGLSKPPREGAQGLAIVRKRLAVRYGDRASFRLAASGGRTRAVVRLPALGSA